MMPNPVVTTLWTIASRSACSVAQRRRKAAARWLLQQVADGHKERTRHKTWGATPIRRGDDTRAILNARPKPEESG